MEKSGSNEVSITKVSVKKEEDIKAFAETAMNELLGWYGYESHRNEPKAPRNCRSHSGSNDSEGESLKFTEGCGWCGKPVDESNGLISASAVFCSELCFSQSRRASFKRNKTCDWCRHIRHTVSYVDFQDGASQLQFCSDKCLNQYKMHIFCRETRAHLELHPHLHGDESTSTNLITPDLWLRNCKSPINNSPPSSSPTVSVSSILPDVSSQNLQNHQLSTLPLITVASNAKLLATDVKRNRLKVQKKFRKRCSSTITSFDSTPTFNDIPQDLRIRHTPPIDEVVVESPDFKSFTKEEKSPYVMPKEDFETKKCSSNDPPSLSSPSMISTSHVKAILGNLLPPPTTFVPYPVILPLPIPIPIPIPIPKMFKTNNGKELIELKDCSSQTDTTIANNDVNENINVETKEKSSDDLLLNKRPLRKRKKVTETKTKIFVKHKKTLL